VHVSLRVTALAAALLVTQQACGSPASTPAASGGASVAASGGIGSAPSDAPSSPAKTTSATTTKTPAPAGGSAALSGDRQFYFFVLDKGVEVPESLLAATSGGRVEVNGDFSGRALFVPSPTSPGGKEHLIKTGKLRAGGEALCLKIRNNGSSPLTVVTAACDAGDKTQLFLLDKSGKDNQGRMTYAIRNGDAFLQWNPTGTAGLIAEELGDAKLNTTFVMIDRGKSTVPQLDN
jgi:hypothetical protein